MNDEHKLFVPIPPPLMKMLHMSGNKFCSGINTSLRDSWNRAWKRGGI